MTVEKLDEMWTGRPV